jgi:long-subunit acyl-CoA synthetase (AMP-forming)
MSHVDGLIPQLLKHGKRTIRELSASGSIKAEAFASLHRKANSLLSRLTAEGIQTSSRVGILGQNSCEWIVADLVLIELQCLSVEIPSELAAGQRDYNAICDAHNLTALVIINAHNSKADSVIEIFKHPKSGRIEEFDPDALTVVFSRDPNDPATAITISKRDTSNAIESFVNVWAPSSGDHLLVVVPFTSFQQRFLVYLAIRYGFDITLAPNELMHQALQQFSPTIMSNDRYLWMSLGGRSFPRRGS